MSKDIPTLYGSLVFSDKVMRNKLPKDVYKALRKTIENGTHLELECCKFRSRCHERVGSRKRSNTFHSLVPANDQDLLLKNMTALLLRLEKAKLSWNFQEKNW